MGQDFKNNRDYSSNGNHPWKGQGMRMPPTWAAWLRRAGRLRPILPWCPGEQLVVELCMQLRIQEAEQQNKTAARCAGNTWSLEQGPTGKSGAALRGPEAG